MRERKRKEEPSLAARGEEGQMMKKKTEEEEKSTVIAAFYTVHMQAYQNSTCMSITFSELFVYRTCAVLHTVIL